MSLERLGVLGAVVFGALVLGSTASAQADGPYKWSGLYIGGHVGGAFSGDWNGSSVRSVSPQWNLAFDQDDTAVLGGGQLGYNFQSMHWVAGIEVDISWTGLSGGSRIGPVLTDLGLVGNSFAFMNRDVNWVASLRGRLGYALGNSLLYATGGYAVADVSYSADTNFVGNGGLSYPASDSARKSGYVLGGGFEQVLSGGWSARGEYLFYSLGSHNLAAVPDTTAKYHWDKTEFHVLRAGLNYKFN